eukprot:m.418127 g.418127  ORF g.418127 m.418127 type:complete len:52 (+) comp30764_c0_seq1:370-525(+)
MRLIAATFQCQSRCRTDEVDSKSTFFPFFPERADFGDAVEAATTAGSTKVS